MKEITIIAVGDIKENWYREAVGEYLKRISAYAKVNVRELKEERLPEDKPNEAEIQKALQKEGAAIITSLPKRAYAISLCIEGEKYTSERFAELLSSAPTEKHLTFIIGSSHGLSDEVKAKSDLKLSLSDMTFPHRLARVMLCEQLYRGFSILNNGKYHK